jgi:hypothetical protein
MLLVAATATLSERPAMAVPPVGFGHGEWVEIKDARLKIERNDTDGDAGIHVNLDADPWRWMELYDASGRRLMRATMGGAFGIQGGTELFIESGEPSFDELSYEDFLLRFPAGEYTFRGRGVDGENFYGFATLTHDVPDGPALVGPHDDGTLVDPDDATLEWEPVSPPNGSPIVGYQAIISLSGTGIPGLPKIVLDVMMPPTATTLDVPPGFLRPGTLYEWEVLSVEESGNQTLSGSFLRTAP